MFSRQFVANLLFIGKKVVSLAFSLALIVLILLIVLTACSNGAVFSNISNAL